MLPPLLEDRHIVASFHQKAYNLLLHGIQNFRSLSQSQTIKIRDPLGGGGANDPTLNLKLSPKLKEITTRNLPYIFWQQFHTLCQKIRS